MGVLDLLFPKNCVNCGRSGQYICGDCLSKIRPAKPICPYCEKASIDGLTHIKCAKKFGIDGLVCPWDYEGVIRRAILSLKFKYATEVGRELFAHFITAIKSPNSKFIIPNSSLLIPVPMYWYNQNVRGFNQAVELGKLLSQEMDWKFVSDLLIKKTQTISQVELKGDERRKNLKGVFSLNPNYLVTSDPSVILFDDVFTTGSTLMEAGKTLKRGGVAKVWGLTIAR